MAYAKRNRQPVSPSAPIQFIAEPFHYAIPDPELLNDLANVARQLAAKTVMPQQYVKHGRFSTVIFRTRFGNWNAALRRAGLQPSSPQRVTDKAMLKDLAKVAAKLGTPDLHRADYARDGKYGTTTIALRFGSWSAAKLAAGLIAAPVAPRNPSNVELFDNFERIWCALGRQPRGSDVVLPQSRFDLRAYKRRFGTFRKALAMFIARQQQTGKITGSPEPMEPAIRHKTHREVRAAMRYQILNRDKFKCRLCGRSPATDAAVQLHIDHIKPWSRGGETTLENLQTLCETCNAGKSDSGKFV